MSEHMKPHVTIWHEAPELAVPDMPAMLSDAGSLWLAYATTSEPRGSVYAVIRFSEVIEHRLSPINDEGLGQHEYAAAGLKWYTFNEVRDSKASLYQPDIEAEFVLEGQSTQRMLKARFVMDGKPATYQAAVMKLAPGVIHLVALAKIPGLMPNMSDDHLWAELTGPRYTTPLLRSWIPWLKDTMTECGGIVGANGFRATVGVLKTEPEALDELVSQGVRERALTMCG